MAELIPTGSSPAINSAEIAELVGKRHDNVKRTIETLIEQGVIESPQIEEIPTATKPMQAFRFEGERGKRDSIVVVAQLSPGFTARLVDRWQQLEAAIAARPAFDPAALSKLDVLRLAIESEERRIEAEAKVAELAATVQQQAPKVAALERFAEHQGEYNTRNAAKVLGVQERWLVNWLLVHGWYYRDHSGRLCAKADKIVAGYLDTHPVVIRRSEGDQVVPQPVITQRGITRLGVLLASKQIPAPVLTPEPA